MKTQIKFTKVEMKNILDDLWEEYEEGLCSWTDYSDRSRQFQQRLASLEVRKEVILTD